MSELDVGVSDLFRSGMCCVRDWYILVPLKNLMFCTHDCYVTAFVYCCAIMDGIDNSDIPIVSQDPYNE